MSMIPSDNPGKIQWFEDHLEPWTTNAVAIGSTTSDVSAMSTKTAAARAAYTAQQEALQAARVATDNVNALVRAMAVAGNGIIKQVRAKAETSGNLNVYTLAAIPMPSTPQPQGNPGTPFDFKAEVDSTGALGVKWKNSNATGCVYNVWRKIGTADFEFLIGVAKKRFTDATVPAGTAVVEYQVQAVRPSGISNWAPFTVKLGVAANGLPMATVSEQPAKAAA